MSRPGGAPAAGAAAANAAAADGEAAATNSGAGSRAQLLQAVQIMDQLRSPGGCPWDAEQTHQSLAPYLLEEAYETLDAIETGDLTSLREELGDLLLQVLFHARLAEEAPEADRFTIDDVAGDLVAKLVRRHPHVFAESSGNDTGGPGGPGLNASQVAQSWDEIKKVEKQRTSVTDGVPLGQPALALAAKLVGRSGKAGLAIPVPGGDGFGERLLALVSESVAAGVDPEQALRETARAYRDAIRDRERGPETES